MNEQELEKKLETFSYRTLQRARPGQGKKPVRKRVKRTCLRPQACTFKTTRQKIMRTKMCSRTRKENKMLDSVSERLAKICGMEVGE